MEAVAIIPARYASTRFPGKPLVDIAGIPMIKRVCMQVAKCKSISRYVVATDDDRIYTYCQAEKLPVAMTLDSHASGTERIAEVAADVQADIFLNVQGDEPFLDPTHLDAVCGLFQDDRVQIGTLMTKIYDADTVLNTNVVKVVATVEKHALYFSRSPIPYNGRQKARYFRHLGIYAFRPSVLQEISTLPPTPLEQDERLEQLRWLEHGFRIAIAEVDGSAPALDTPADLDLALAWMTKNWKET